MKLIIAVAVLALLLREVFSLIRDNKRQKESISMSREVKRIRNEWSNTEVTIRESTRRQEEIEREVRRQAREAERERVRQAAEIERIAKEQEKQAAQLAKHEERIFKLEQRMASAESELAFNREQRDRLFKLLDIEERERDGAIPESATWQKHQRKVISLENQIHTVQKRIDKAKADRLFCEMQMSA